MSGRRYTEEEFRAAVADPEVRTLADLCRALGLVPRGANYDGVREYAHRCEITLNDHLRRSAEQADGHSGAAFRRRSYTEDEFLDALTDPEVNSYQELCARLGLRSDGATHRRLRRLARVVGYEIPTAWGHRRAEASAYADEATLRAVVARSDSRADVIRALGDVPRAASYQRLQEYLEQFDIDTSHFRPHRASGRTQREPLDRVLVRGRLVTSSSLRRRLIAEGHKEHRCEACQATHWQGKRIPLELDHVDGDRWNNRLENLRLLCPNCHALTPTYRGRNRGRR